MGVGVKVSVGEVKQREDTPLTRPSREALLEADHLLSLVAAGRGEKADPGDLLTGEPEHEGIEGGARLGGGEATASQGQNPPRVSAGD